MRSQSDGSFPDSIPVSEDGESLDLDHLLTGRGFVTGKSGSGKSNTASVLAEEILDLGLSLLVVDTDGEYHGLGASYDVLHAGEGDDCDVALGETEAARLAELAVDEDVPVVLDVSGYVDPERASAVVESVLRELFALEAERRKPFLVFVEEIHEYLPQQGGLDDLGTLLLQIAKRGRKRGLGLCGLSQRPAAVDKEFITQCDWFVWHRLTWESDVDVVRRFLDADRADQIERLSDGEAFVVTDWDDGVRRVQFRRRHTPDAGATPSLSDLSEAEAPTGTAHRSDAPTQSTQQAEEVEEPPAHSEERTTDDARRATESERAATDTEQTATDPPGGEPSESLVVEIAELLAYVVRRTGRGIRRAALGLRDRVR